jgi:hypothetical protein
MVTAEEIGRVEVFADLDPAERTRFPGWWRTSRSRQASLP